MTGVNSGRRLWVRRAALIIVAPTVFFACLETVLRLFSPNTTSFFQTFEAQDRRWTAENLHFGKYYFRNDFPRVPAWSLFPEQSEGAARIAVIGESAAAGFPLQKIGLSRVLQAVLETEYAGREFDMINACMTAVNSHVLERVAADVAAQMPDVTVIYMGNNEVVGPYGPGTPFVSWIGIPGLVWLDKQLRSTATFASLESLMSGVASSPARRWEGFQMFENFRVEADSESLQPVYKAFEKNLSAMVEDLLAAGSKVVLCTVAVNLADWGPSGHVPMTEGSAAFVLLEEGKQAFSAGNNDSAVAAFEKAARLDPVNAEIPFRLGRALLAAGKMEAARAAFEKARDLDTHRFRADSTINAIIRRTADRFASRGVVLVDAARQLAKHGVTSRQHFIDHVHPSFAGMVELASLVARRLHALFPQWGQPAQREPAQLEALSTRLFFTPFDEVTLAHYARNIGVTGIFRARPSGDEVNSHFLELEKKIRSENPLDAPQLQKAYDASVAVRRDDPHRDASCASYLWKMGQYGPASLLAQRVFEQKPNHYEAMLMAGDVALQRKDPEAAEIFFRKALAIHGALPEALKGLGDAAGARGNLRRAESLYEKAWRADPSQDAAAASLANLHMRASNFNDAMRVLKAARQLNTNSPALENAMAAFHIASRQNASARECFERALQIDATASPRDYLRLMSIAFPGAEEKKAYEKYEDRIANSPELLNNFAWLLATSPDETIRDSAKSVRLAKRAVEISITRPSAYYFGTLAAAEAAQGNFDAALDTLQKGRELAPDDLRFAASADRMESAFRSGRPYFEAE